MHLSDAHLPDQMARPLRLVEGLARIEALQALDGYRGEVVAAISALLDAEGVDVLAVPQSVAAVNDVLTRRLLSMAEAELGPPPCDYAWLALGSHGRGEQVPSSDQDSALAYAPRACPDTDPHGGADADPGTYFGRLAGLVVPALARAGMPLCDGGYMATRWCRPVGELRRQFAGWVDAPEPAALLQAEVFLDVRPVHGALAVGVLDRTLVAGGSRGPFQVQMARAAVTFRPPLGLLGRLRTVDGAVDVKRGGTAAVVLLARLYALAGGSSARSTLLRLQAAADSATLSRPAAAELAEGYRFLTGLRLRHQVEQVRQGQTPDNVIDVGGLPRAQREQLRATLRHVRDVQDSAALRFATHTVV